jgi:hypothetical protein
LSIATTELEHPSSIRPSSSLGLKQRHCRSHHRTVGPLSRYASIVANQELNPNAQTKKLRYNPDNDRYLAVIAGYNVPD